MTTILTYLASKVVAGRVAKISIHLYNLYVSVGGSAWWTVVCLCVLS
jgi:hypothetical protein